MSVKAVLIDDEVHNVNVLRELLCSYCPQVSVCATALNADDGAAIILEYKPDIVFLDIQMPVKTAFDLLRSLSQYDFEIIFVTAYDNYAIQAMRFAALDYLLKPLNIAELQSAVERAIKKCLLKANSSQLENLIHLLKEQKKEERHIALTTSKETRFVKTSEIIRCQSSNNYCKFYLEGKEELLVCRPIYEFEELLKDYGFIRCHQSHLVNKRFIKSWKKEFSDLLVLVDGTQVPVSRNKKDDVRKAMNA